MPHCAVALLSLGYRMISSLSTFYPSNSSPFDVHVNQGQKSLYSIWNGHPTFNRESLQWVYKPLRIWVDEFIPYHMEIMGVDRPDRTCGEYDFCQTS